MARLTTFSKLLITLLIVGIVFFAARYFLGQKGLLQKQVTVVDKLEKPTESTSLLCHQRQSL